MVYSKDVPKKVSHEITESGPINKNMQEAQSTHEDINAAWKEARFKRKYRRLSRLPAQGLHEKRKRKK